MGRRPCCSKDEGLNRGAWTAMEDKALTEYIRIHGEGKWRNLPKRAGLKRCGKSCRLRWLNYLRPDIKRGNITCDEEELIIRLHKLLGNRWSLIAGRLPGRTDNEIKNYWNTTIGKKVQGHSFSDGNRKSPNQSQEKPKPTKSLQSPNKLANTNSCTRVVRTKASRCTKVVIPREPQKIDDHDQIGDNEHVVNAPILTNIDQVKDQIVGINDEPLSPIFLLDDENMSSGGFMVDFKMDENFLSDFLNVDFSQLFNNCNGGDKAAAETCDKGHSRSPNEAIFFSEDKLHGPDFQSSIAPIVDSELDWLMDNTAN